MLASSKGFFLGPSLRFLLLCFYRNIFSHFFPFSGKLLCWNCFSSVLQIFGGLLPIFLDWLLLAQFCSLECYRSYKGISIGFFPGEFGLCFLFSLCDYNIAYENLFCKTECCTNKDICNCTKHRFKKSLKYSIDKQHLFVLYWLYWAALPSGPFLFTLCSNYFTISLATWIPLAEAWDREWVMPEPSPMMYRPS